MKILIYVILIIAALFVLDRFCLWLERNGWLYYRHQKSSGGFLGNVLLELNTLLNPSTRHVIEVKESKEKKKQSNSGVPGELLDKDE